MERRDFLKVAALTGAAIAVPGLEAAASSVAGSGAGSVFGSAVGSSASGTGVASAGAGVERYADKPVQKFRFRPDGKFKVLQFTDTHYIAGNPKSERALKNVIQMLDIEKPDLVIHTGDIVYGNPADAAAREIFQPLVDRGVPFAVALGNHESDFAMKREEIFEVIRSIKGNINTPMRPDIYGCSNDVITLSSENGVEQVFYLFDSGAYLECLGEKGYDYIRHNQIEWYRCHSEAITATNSGKPVSSLAFFHIPVREFCDAVRDTHRDMVGVFCEEPCPSRYNSGLVANFLEKGDVHSIICGHDHDNDFVLKHGNMFYLYGRFSGCDNEYNNIGPSGARIFEFTKGQPGYRTYIRKYGQDTIEQDLHLTRGMSHLLSTLPKM